MKNKLLSTIIMTSLALQLVACGVKDTGAAETELMEAQTEVTAETEQMEVEAEVAASEKIEETTENATVENSAEEISEEESESQRQVQPFEGQYYAGRGNLSITGHDDGEYLIEVWWGSSASENSQWVMHGTYDESTETITYSDCVKEDFVIGDNGEPTSDEIAYEGGTGSIKIVDDSTIMWTDDQDHIADDVPMTR